MDTTRKIRKRSILENHPHRKKSHLKTNLLLLSQKSLQYIQFFNMHS